MDGVISHIDDILIHAQTIEHDSILNEVLRRLEEGLTLNKKKMCIQNTKISLFRA